MIYTLGGVDHIPIHHENEIAQSKGCTGKIPAAFWMHCEFLQINGGKMSKSLNNLYTIKDLQEKGYDPLAYRMFNFTSHYRNKINFTWEALESAQISLDRLKEGYLKHYKGNAIIDDNIIAEYKQKFLEAINDDLNMPVAMSVVWEIIKQKEKSKKYAELLIDFDKVLGLDLDKKNIKENNKEEIPENVKQLIKKRNIARQNKDWNTSDEIRAELQQLGYNIKDTIEGTILI